jgi:hypothetical protein
MNEKEELTRSQSDQAPKSSNDNSNKSPKSSVNTTISKEKNSSEPEHTLANFDLHLPKKWAQVAWAVEQENEDETIEYGEEYGTVYSSAESFKPTAVSGACVSLLSILHLFCDKLAKEPREYILYHFDISKRNVLVNKAGEAIVFLDWENITPKSLSQIYPWPSIIDYSSSEPPEPWQKNEPRPKWHIQAEETTTLDWLQRRSCRGLSSSIHPGHRPKTQTKSSRTNLKRILQR